MALLEIRMVHWLRQQKYLYFFIIYFRDKNEKKKIKTRSRKLMIKSMGKTRSAPVATC